MKWRAKFIALPVCFAAGLSAQSQPPADQVTHTQDGSQLVAHSNQGTENSPLVVKVEAVQKTKEEAKIEAEERQEKFSVDAETVLTNERLLLATKVLAVVAFLQLVVYIYQSIQLTRSVNAGTEQSKAVERHINEAARQARATEDLAKNAALSAEILKARTAAQMRAYLYVDAGQALFQEGVTVFEGRPLLINGGFTPAHKVNLKIRAAILPNPLPDDFVFKSPYGFEGSNVIGPRQDLALSAIAETRCDDVDVEAVKRGDKQAFYTWGLITYEDIFGDAHETEFCRIYLWAAPQGPIRGIFVAGHNNST